MKSDDWKAKAELIIQATISSRTTITYKTLAADAGIPSPHTIHQLTMFLEDLIDADAALGLPIRASVVVSRTNNIPGDGFFIKLKACGIIPTAGEDSASFHQRLISQL